MDSPQRLKAESLRAMLRRGQEAASFQTESNISLGTRSSTYQAAVGARFADSRLSVISVTPWRGMSRENACVCGLGKGDLSWKARDLVRGSGLAGRRMCCRLFVCWLG